MCFGGWRQSARFGRVLSQNDVFLSILCFEPKCIPIRAPNACKLESQADCEAEGLAEPSSSLRCDAPVPAGVSKPGVPFFIRVYFLTKKEIYKLIPTAGYLSGGGVLRVRPRATRPPQWLRRRTRREKTERRHASRRVFFPKKKQQKTPTSF